LSSEVSYEAQAAIALEMSAPDRFMQSSNYNYPIHFAGQDGTTIVKLANYSRALAADVRQNTAVSRYPLSCTGRSLVSQLICAAKSRKIQVINR